MREEQIFKKKKIKTGHYSPGHMFEVALCTLTQTTERSQVANSKCPSSHNK